MKLLVDADASPKKETIFQLSKHYQLSVLLVSSISHYSIKELPENVERVWVDTGSDQADFKIVQLTKADDIIITGDYGLASMLLPKKCRVLHHDGYEYTEKIMQKLIDSRHLSAKMRRVSKRNNIKSLSPFSDEEQQPFETLLETIIKEQVNRTED